MFDASELPPPVRVKIPRIRNGDLLYAEVANADEERARLLGILAILISETYQETVYDRHTVPPTGIALEIDITPEIVEDNKLAFRESLETIMTWLMYNDMEAFIAIMEGIQEQDEVDKAALSIFKAFMNTMKEIGND